MSGFLALLFALCAIASFMTLNLSGVFKSPFAFSRIPYCRPCLLATAILASLMTLNLPGVFKLSPTTHNKQCRPCLLATATLASLMTLDLSGVFKLSPATHNKQCRPCLLATATLASLLTLNLSGLFRGFRALSLQRNIRYHSCRPGLLAPAILASLLTLTPAFATGAVIQFQNRSPDPICYKVESSWGSIPTSTTCVFTPGFWVDAGTNFSVVPTGEFVGAITAVAPNGFLGTRHEMGFPPDGSTWYDIDYEMGISNSTFGPADHRLTKDGSPSLAGEVNALAKANDVWVQIEDKSPLAPHYYYVEQQGPSGNLSRIRIDKLAPVEIKTFFQLDAGLNGYVGPGSVEGMSEEMRKEKMVSWADKQTREVDTQEMEIIAY